MNIAELLENLATGIIAAEEDFLKAPREFYEFENRIHRLFDRSASEFIGAVLTEADELISKLGYREHHYNIQRHDSRMLTTTVGDVSFTHTLYTDRETGQGIYLLDRLIGLNSHERFSEAAEVEILREAVNTSYERASKVLHTESAVSRTTVMNKVHGIAGHVPNTEAEEKRKCEILFIETDEDHIAEQHGRYGDNSANGTLIGRLAYIFEDKVEDGKDRKKLLNPVYFSGLYEGKDGVKMFWKNVDDYIRKNYDTDVLKRIYVIGDGAQWIRSAASYLSATCVPCLDRFHLVKYIDRASKQMLDEADIAKAEIYRMLYHRDKEGFTEYTDLMASCAKNPEPVITLQTYVKGNWRAIMNTIHDGNYHGSSTEGHVSSVLSDRMSSRPKGWSRTGADRMCKLRAYVRNNGEGRIIELVRYSRNSLAATGTDDCFAREFSAGDVITKTRNEAASYIDRFQATIPGQTVRKMLAIREQIGLY